MDMHTAKEDTQTLKSNKLDIDDINRTNERLEDRIEEIFVIATEAKDKAAEVESETNNIENNASPYPSPPGSFPKHAPVKTSPTSDKYKLSLVQSLNAKEILDHFSTLKFQVMMHKV